MRLFGGTQIETNERNLVRNVIAWIGLNRTTDSNKLEVIVLDDQKSRELRRIRTTGLAVYLCDCTILCGSRKYPYPPHGWFFRFYPPPPWNFPSRGSFVDPPTPQEFPFFWRGFFFKLTAFLSLNKSENSSMFSHNPN